MARHSKDRNPLGRCRRDRRSLHPLCRTAVTPRTEDPAAQTPSKPEWMSKIKDVSQVDETPPTWMKTLIMNKQGLPLDEKRPEQTPPWKLRDRLREEQQAKKLTEALGLEFDGDEHGGEVGNDDNLSYGGS
jgi:hypothetical protein